MNLLSKDSIILSNTELKLSDTEYVFKRGGIIGNFEYCLLEPELGYFIDGHHRLGVQIKNNDKEIVYCYGANRPTSNANSIGIATKISEKYFLVVEDFRDIYSGYFSLARRAICLTDSLFDNSTFDRKDLIYNNEVIDEVTEEEYKLYEEWLKCFNLFSEALSDDYLDRISLIKRKIS